MIDYDKLRKAHELAKLLPYFDWSVTHRFGNPDSWFVLSFDDHDGMFHEYHYEHDEIDDLITKLKTLTELEPKYKEGDMVWLIDCDCICTAKIIKYDADEYKISDCDPIDGSLRTGKDWAQESELYPTKPQLIEAQIEYWQSLRDQSEEAIDIAPTLPDDFVKKVFDHYDAKECQHETDGQTYINKVRAFCMSNDNYQLKCIKCGEFYR